MPVVLEDILYYIIYTYYIYISAVKNNTLTQLIKLQD